MHNATIPYCCCSMRHQSEKKAKREAMIPDEVIVSEILVRLPAMSVIRFRSVCKSWHSLTRAPSFLRAHTRRAQASVVMQTLFEFWSPLDLLRIDHCSSSDEIKIRTSQIVVPDDVTGWSGPNTCDLFMRGSCDGLFCFSDEDCHRGDDRRDPPYLVCNLAAKEWITVPKTQKQQRDIVRSYLQAFYYHPPSEEYRLLDLCEPEPEAEHCIKGIKPTVAARYQVYSLRRGGSVASWRQIHDVFYDDPPPCLVSRVTKGRLFLGALLCVPHVALNATVHWAPWLPEDDWILAFDVEPEKFRKIAIPDQLLSSDDDRRRRSSAERHHLIKFEEKLGLCRVDSSWKEMETWLLNEYAKEEWVRLHVISLQSIMTGGGGGILRRGGGGYNKSLFQPLALWNNGEALVLRWNFEVFILYNLKLGQFKVLGEDCKVTQIAFSTETLTSLSYSF